MEPIRLIIALAGSGFLFLAGLSSDRSLMGQALTLWVLGVLWLLAAANWRDLK